MQIDELQVDELQGKCKTKIRSVYRIHENLSEHLTPQSAICNSPIKSMTIQSIRGIHDILPQTTYYWRYVESKITTILDQYSYQQIKLPILEKTQLFKQSIGSITDIVEKEMYSFDDRNGENISLRPEGTAGCVRACIENGLLYNQVQKLWYIGPMFRHERPQKGRYRQFHQLGVETFGFEGSDIDAELIMLCHNIWQSLKLDNLQLEINTLGSRSARKVYTAELVIYLSKYIHDLDQHSQKRLQTNPLRILDSKNEKTRQILETAPKLSSYLTTTDKEKFNDLITTLDDLDIQYTINDKLVRGLDYYGHSVFEWKTEQSGAQDTVCAGGRYDALIDILNNKPGFASGFSLGIERLVELLVQKNLLDIPYKVADIYIVVTTKSATSKALLLATQIRSLIPTIAINTGSYIMSFKSQLKQAEKFKASIALIIGERELISNTITYKSLRNNTQGQHNITTAQLLEKLKHQF